MANLIPRYRRVTIGGEDWSDFLTDLEYGYGSIFESGLSTISGSLQVIEHPDNPSSINPRINPTLWKPGQTVNVEVEDDSGNWVQAASLLIGGSVALPSNGVLTVPLTCKLGYLQQKSFEGDESGIEVGEAINSAELAERLLKAVGFSDAELNLGTWDYDINYPLSKADLGSYIDQAGSLAWSNNCRFIMQDPSGVIVSGIWNKTDPPVVSFTYGQESIFEPLTEPLEPVERVVVSGKGFDIQELPTEISNTVSIIDAASNYSSGGVGTVTISVTEVLRVVDTRDDPDPSKRELKIVEITKVVQPRSVLWLAADSATADFTMSENAKIYDPDTGRLERIRKCKEVHTRAFLESTPGLVGRTLAYDEVTTFTYDDERGIVLKTFTRRTEPRVTVDQEVDQSRFSHTPTKEVTVNYVEEKPGEWIKKELSRSTASSNSSGRTGSSNPLALVAGLPKQQRDATPPKTEYFENPFSKKLTNYKATVNWEYPGGSTGLNRKRDYIIEPAFSNQNCFDVATKEAEILEGRYASILVEFEIAEAAIALTPWSVISMDDGNNIWTFRLDSPTYSYKGDKAYLGGVGVVINREVKETPDPDSNYPAYPVFTSGIVAGQTAPDEPPSFNPYYGNGSGIIGYELELVNGYDEGSLEPYDFAIDQLPKPTYL